MEYFIWVIVAILVTWFFVISFRKLRKPPFILNREHESILEAKVPFYRELGPEEKKEFSRRLQHFLSTTRITGVKTRVEDLDRILICASAIIPIFRFPNWKYTNLGEVLLYPDSFSDDFRQSGPERNLLGIVGTGPLQRVMVLSKQELMNGFDPESGKSNTALHEFVHLVDKTDGATDGVPEAIMNRAYVLPWLKLMHQKIREIEEGNSDINPYGATNESEFLAVAAEYFFKHPELLRENHPELYAMLEKIFMPGGE